VSRDSLKPLQSSGFTIVELMIATVVLSVILLLSTVMITSIGNLYYKGVNKSRLQDDARTIANDVSQRLELQANSTQLPGTDGETYPYGSGSIYVAAICIGSTRYSYIEDSAGQKWQIGSGGSAVNQVPHIFWRDTNPSASCTALDLTKTNPPGSGSDGTELISANSSVSYFSVDTTSAPYGVKIDLAYGDRTLLSGVGLNATCKGGAGDQFCATATVSTAATPRLQ